MNIVEELTIFTELEMNNCFRIIIYVSILITQVFKV